VIVARQPLAPAVAAPAIQRYTLIQSGNGKLASSGDVIVNKGQLFATNERIADSNRQLAVSGPHGSLIKLVKQGEPKKTKEAPGKDFFEVVPEVHTSAYFARQNSTPGGFHEGLNIQKEAKLELWADCRRAAEAVTGASSSIASHDSLVKVGGQAIGGYTGSIERPSGVKNDSTTARLAFQVYATQIPLFLAKKGYDRALFDPRILTLFTGLKTTEGPGFTVWLKQQAALAGANISIAERLYSSLTTAAKAEFHRDAGTNEFANPQIGDSYSTVTEYGMPGFKESGDDWQFHWGGVVMKGGTDNVTLENLSISKEKARNTKWYFAMYGTADPAQSFHTKQMESGHHANIATTIAVETVGSAENRLLQSLRQKVSDLGTLEARIGADLRPQILAATVTYNEKAEFYGKQKLTTYEVLGSERAFTPDDLAGVHHLKTRWIPA
jgi:hypothetical protein